MSSPWHDGEGKAARIRVPPPSLIPKGGTRLGRGDRKARRKPPWHRRCHQGSRLPPRVLSASGRRPAPTDAAAETGRWATSHRDVAAPKGEPSRCATKKFAESQVSPPPLGGAGAQWAPLNTDRGGSRDKSVPRFPPSFPVFSIRSHLFPTVPIPSSTQNAPGFAFFWLFRVRFAVFALF